MLSAHTKENYFMQTPPPHQQKKTYVELFNIQG